MNTLSLTRDQLITRIDELEKRERKLTIQNAELQARAMKHKEIINKHNKYYIYLYNESIKD